MDHDVLQLKVAVDDENLHHGVKAHHNLAEDNADDLWRHFVLLDSHQLLQVDAVAIIHKHVVATLSLYGLTHAYRVRAVNGVLVLDLAHNQRLIAPAEAAAFDDLAGAVSRELR